ncbi:MAG: hypothetical protein AVDCRST_MAG05-799, partial [uncultured Rubrobacteraceae bacterium]
CTRTTATRTASRRRRAGSSVCTPASWPESWPSGRTS